MDSQPHPGGENYVLLGPSPAMMARRLGVNPMAAAVPLGDEPLPEPAPPPANPVPVRSAPNGDPPLSPPPTWQEVLEMPEMRALKGEELEAARLQYFVDVVAPMVPTAQLKAARAAFDADTEEMTRAAGVPTPTWEDVLKKPEMEGLSSDQLEQAREQYFAGVVAPRIPPGQLEAARAEFDKDTRPGPITRAVRAIGDAVSAIRDDSDRRWAERGYEAVPSPDEIAQASRPALMTLTRGGQPVLETNTPAPVDRPSAAWGDVAASLPAQFVAGTRGAAANLERMAAEESVAQREEALRPAQSDPSGWGALVKPSAIARQQARLEADREDLANAVADAAQANLDARLVTPADMTTAQQALSSLAQSAGPTLLGLAAGILTRSPAVAMAIAGPGGAAQQAGATYGEARDAHGATHRQASVAAAIDAALEGGGEALPLGFALKPGTPVFRRIFGMIARESGQEAATQFAQDLRAMAMENPKLTLGEVWQNMKVAALAGAGGGAVYGGAGAAVNAAREREGAEVGGIAPTTAVAGGDRRTDAQRRARVDDMTPEQMRRELLTSPMGGIGNRRAYDEAVKKQVQVAIDADSLKWLNDNLGHEAGDELLRAIGESLGAVAPQDSYHLSGDEFVLQADNAAAADRMLAALAEEIGHREITYEAPDGRIFTFTPRITHGKGQDLREADAALGRAKVEREQAGERAGRGERPVGLAEATPLGWETEDQAPGEVDALAREDAGAGTHELPAKASTDADVRTADAQVEPDPTSAQKHAENYRMGHLRWQGLDISIETPKGGTRTAKDGSWTVPNFPASYGRFKGTRGADGDHVDVFMGDAVSSPRVFVIDQVDPETGAFDEHKVMAGYRERDDALSAYDAAFSDGSGPARRGAVSAVSVAELKRWLERGANKGPLNEKGLERRAERFATLAQAVKGGRLAAYSAEDARRHAAAERSSTGQPHRVLEHPTRPGRFAVLPEAFLASSEGRGLKGSQRGAVIPTPATENRAQMLEGQGASASGAPAVPPNLPPEARREGATAAADRVEPGERQAVGIALTAPYRGGADAATVTDAKRARPDAIRQAVRDLFRVPINEGGFKTSRDVLGLYKVKPRTIRVRNQNDIGVIAHETGHHFSESSKPVRELMKTHELELRKITPYAAKQKTAALQREEGFAEYLRLRWMTPAQARAAAPGFNAAFEKYIDANGHRPAFDAIEGAIRDWQNLPPADRILAKVGEGEREFRKRFDVDRIIFEVFDRWLPLKSMVAELKPDIAPSADPFKLAHLLAGDAAIIEDWLLRETVPFNFERRADVEDRGKPLSEILKPIAEQQRDFGAYLIAKRANELMRRGKEHLYSADEIAAGLQLETPEFKAAAEALYEYQDRLLDYAVEGGLLSAGAARAFRSHPFYVPFFRVGEPVARRGGNIFKEIRGGTENLRDPIANIIENTVRVIHATNRNYVLAKAHDLARAVPGGGRWLEDVPMPERAVKVETMKVIEALRAQGVEIDPEAAEAMATSQTFFVKNPFGDDRYRIIVIRRQGRPHALQVNDDLLWRALERFEPVDMGFLEKLLAVPADTLRAGIVLSPEFMARNFARDTLSGFLQSKEGLIPVASTVEGFKEIATRSDAARLYRAFGGAYGDMWRADRGLERTLVERMARHGGFDPRTIVTPRGLISLLHRLGSVAEAGTRVAEFKKTMEPGDIDSLIDAAYNAREVSVDFGMHGHSRSVRFLTRITPFLNPALQGWYKLSRTAKAQPLITLLRGGALAAASIALYLHNRDEEWYDEIEQWERNTYWHVDLGLRDPQGQVIPLRIPKPFEAGGIFASIPEALAAVAIDQHGKQFGERLKSIFEDVFLLRGIPTALLVPTELWANKNQFTGRPIVPESKERLDPELQATAGTSLTARKAGELTGAAPAKIDHAIRGFFGTLGVYTTMLADLALSPEDNEPAAALWPRALGARVFFRDPSGANSRHVTEFYEHLKKARRAGATLRSQPDAAAARAYADRHRDELRFLGPGNKAAGVMGKLRSENERIGQLEELSGEEKRERISANNARIRAIAKGIVRKAQP